MSRDTSMALAELDIPERTFKALKSAGLTTVGEVVTKSLGDLRAIPRLGTIGVNFLRQALLDEGFRGDFEKAWEFVYLPPKYRPNAPYFGNEYDACVYFMRCKRFVKIGISNNLPSRLETIRHTNPYRVSVWHFEPCETYEDAYRREKALHVQFASFRHAYEWFRLTPELVAFIREGRRYRRRLMQVAA